MISFPLNVKPQHLIFTAVLSLFCFFSQGQLSERGMLQTRTIGQVEIGYRIDPSGDGVLCSVEWNDSLAGLAYLDSAHPTEIWLWNGRSCRLTFLPAAGNGIAQLRAGIPDKGKKDTLADQTTLVAAWKPSSQGVSATVSDSIVYQLTPVVTVVTKPIGAYRNNAAVSLYAGSVLIYSATMTQAAPFISTRSDIILGDLKINSGLQFTLQIPTAVQSGSVRLQCTFSALNIPPTGFDAFVATWGL